VLCEKLQFTYIILIELSEEDVESEEEEEDDIKSFPRSKSDWEAFRYLALICVEDPNPVGFGPFWSDPDPDVWDRIRILA
jgi:hypothetical protein